MGVVSRETGPEADGVGRRRGSPAHRIAWRHATRPADHDHVELRVVAERQRIAGALHDDVSSVLFAIAAGVQRAQALHAGDAQALQAALARVGEQVLDASDALRGVLRSATPVEPVDGVPVAAQRDLDEFARRTGVDAHLVVRGRPRPLPAATERAGLSCLRQALFNIERHAGAGIVVVTLDYTPDGLAVVVQDDGAGLPAGFEPRAVPTDGHHWGFTSMARQVEQRGGHLELRPVEEGGTRLRVSLPG